MSLVVHYWADLQSVHGLRCYGNIARTRMSASVCTRSVRGLFCDWLQRYNKSTRNRNQNYIAKIASILLSISCELFVGVDLLYSISICRYVMDLVV